MTKTEVATIGGGCFWCIEAAYNQMRGVVSAISGYAGGRTKDPTYEEVCSGNSGHAEVVQVTYDPDVLSYQQVLEVFFGLHDPTTMNRQGADVGTQYRSVIFTHDAAQQQVAEATINKMLEMSTWNDPIVTEVAPLTTFYPAEDYHQRYFERNPYAGYCAVVINPKIKKFRKTHAELLKA